MKLCIQELQLAVGGDLRWPAMPPRDGELSRVGRIVVDSGEVQQGDVYWALPSIEENQGVQFAQQAFMRGALGVVADCPIEPWDGSFALTVPDSQLALWELARWQRQHASGPLVAVTGSVGKSTTCELLLCLLGKQTDFVDANQRSAGKAALPLELLKADADQSGLAVVEFDSGSREEAETLARLIRPEVGVVTYCESTASAESELLASFDAQSSVILPGDDRHLREIASRFDLDITWFGRSGECEVAAQNVRFAAGELTFEACGQAFKINIWGRHHLQSALAAIAVGRLFGKAPADMAEALAAFQADARLCVVSHGKRTLIADTGQSSLKATKAALALLREFGTSGRRIAIVGDMCVSDQDSETYVELGQDVVTACGADVLVACGPRADCVADAARLAGMPGGRISAVTNPLQAIPSLNGLLQADDVVLIKGMSEVETERIVQTLLDEKHATAQVA